MTEHALTEHALTARAVTSRPFAITHETGAARARSPIALTCGEPSGIGPEIAAAAWRVLGASVPFFLIGDAAHLPAGTPYVRITDPSEAQMAAGSGLPVLQHDFPGPARAGVPVAAQAAVVLEVIARAVGLARSGAASALCTGPIHKKALKDGAKFAFPGHTEYLAHLAGVDRVVMMLACDGLRVVPATIHIPLADVPATLTADGLRRTVQITRAALIADFGIAAPRIVVAGLNPHAGEGGTMGREEITLITPVLDRLRAEGLDLRGPMSADTMFHPMARARYDAAVCMYHDQALIPIKTIDFAGGVNVTLGLPFVRTSPDHGTAFDIAGRGIADPTSLIAALRMAADMAALRARAGGGDASSGAMERGGAGVQDKGSAGGRNGDGAGPHRGASGRQAHGDD